MYSDVTAAVGNIWFTLSASLFADFGIHLCRILSRQGTFTTMLNDSSSLLPQGPFPSFVAKLPSPTTEIRHRVFHRLSQFLFHLSIRLYSYSFALPRREMVPRTRVEFASIYLMSNSDEINFYKMSWINFDDKIRIFNFSCNKGIWFHFILFYFWQMKEIIKFTF